MSKSSIGKALRYFRKQSQTTQIDVAKKMNKSQQWVSDIENGASVLYWGDVKKLCKIYNITLSELSAKEDELE